MSQVNTLMEQSCNLPYDRIVNPKRMTHVMCTIGESTRDVETILEMMLLGMNTVRLNFSYENHEVHARTIQLIRDAADIFSKKMGYNPNIGIALDTKGPQIRTGLLENQNVADIELRKDENIRITVNRDFYDKCNKDIIFVDYPNMVQLAGPGTKIYLNDGAICLVVKEVAVDFIICIIENSGRIGSNKIVTMPGVAVDLPPVTEKDRYDLKFGVENRVDFILASGVRNPRTIKDIRHLLGERGKDIKIIAKIENLQGLGCIDELITSADGIMVSRGDLMVEIPVEKLVLAQKAILARCNRAGKPAILSSSILGSMKNSYIPQLSEVFDLSNAVLDGADCICLQSETAVGKHPLDCLTNVINITRQAEVAMWYKDVFNDLVSRSPSSIDAVHSVAIAAVEAAKTCEASAIVVLTTSGRSAGLISTYRPNCPIIAVTRCSRAARQANLNRGIIPLMFTEHPKGDWQADIDDRLQYALLMGKKMEIVTMGDTIIIVSAWKSGSGYTNNMRITYAFFESEPVECLIKSDQKSSLRIDTTLPQKPI